MSFHVNDIGYLCFLLYKYLGTNCKNVAHLQVQ